uniref:G_PROTEIN_RECEP_F1_2 domain-containing protein n=1 Tax=Meloidogyne hapla TaxID=6305 RepID=A0A1I8C038_MELHA
MSTPNKVFCCFDQIHYWNSRLCPPIGLIANIGLIYLIINKTPKEMRIHSRILLQTCVIDIALLIVTMFGQHSMDLVTYWGYYYQVVQIICYAIVIFCGFKMVRFVHINSSLTQKMKELNKQLIKTLIVLVIHACFPLILISTNTFIISVSKHFVDLTTLSLLYMFEALLTHWLPILSPLASIYTMRPYREFIFKKLFKIKMNTQK